MAVRVQLQLAALAQRLPERVALVTVLNRSAAALGASLQRELLRTGAACVPAAPACFADAVGAPPSATSLHATMLSAAMVDALPDTLLARLLPFLLARAQRRGLATHGLECSGWAALPLAEALFRAARAVPGALGEAAATFVVGALTGKGTNSWAGGMMRDAGATMTMEAWSSDEGSGTYSHPWTASPALIVPRLLMGLAPLEGVGGDAWRAVGIRPFPTSALPAAALTFPSPRGTFVVSFSAWRKDWGAPSTLRPVVTPRPPHFCFCFNFFFRACSFPLA